MSGINTDLFDIKYMDSLSYGSSPLHRLDPRSKLITTMVFIISVVSFNKYAISELTPFFLYPAVLISLSGIRASFIIKRVLLVSPFAVLVGLLNPIMDRAVLLQIGGFSLSGGWVSFLSLLLRFMLTVMAALILLASTGFNAVCDALLKFKVPKLMVMQLLLFHRYMLVLTDEASRMARAYSLRALRTGVMNVGDYISIISHFLLRAVARAERIYMAMRCRGFDGHVPVMKNINMEYVDVFFITGWMIFFFVCRFYKVPVKIGCLIIGVMR